MTSFPPTSLSGRRNTPFLFVPAGKFTERRRLQVHAATTGAVSSKSRCLRSILCSLTDFDNWHWTQQPAPSFSFRLTFRAPQISTTSYSSTTVTRKLLVCMSSFRREPWFLFLHPGSRSRAARLVFDRRGRSRQTEWWKNPFSPRAVLVVWPRWPSADILESAYEPADTQTWGFESANSQLHSNSRVD